MSSGAVEIVLRQHAEGAAHLALQRAALVRGAHVTLRELGRHDERLDAYLDGLATADEQGARACDLLLADAGYGEVFAATVAAIQASDVVRLDRLFALSGAVPLVHSGVADAFGWVSADCLVGLVKDLLVSSDAQRRLVGIAACAQHLAYSPVLLNLARDADARVRARALRAVGELGRHELLSICAASVGSGDAECELWAMWSAVLLGMRDGSLHTLSERGLCEHPYEATAFLLALQAMSPAAAHGVLQRLAADPQRLRLLIDGSGVAGDPAYVPWLIGHMREPATARAAGESFSVLTGVDLVTAGLENDAPGDFEAGPNDDPEDPDVRMDPDEGLPWPHPVKVDHWWRTHASRFEKGTRYFMGAPVTREHCLDVLRNGRQRQRILAAQYLCLLNPGTPLFNTSAPAWRQHKLLAEMS
jgi:uncharacterized protein (TIGR02270 family)